MKLEERFASPSFILLQLYSQLFSPLNIVLKIYFSILLPSISQYRTNRRLISIQLCSSLCFFHAGENSPLKIREEKREDTRGRRNSWEENVLPFPRSLLANYHSSIAEQFTMPFFEKGGSSSELLLQGIPPFSEVRWTSNVYRTPRFIPYTNKFLATQYISPLRLERKWRSTLPNFNRPRNIRYTIESFVYLLDFLSHLRFHEFENRRLFVRVRRAWC